MPLQLGHQAAQCTVGTVNWQQMYGEDVFKLKKAVFQSDIDALKKAKEINFTELEKRAKDYAKVGLRRSAPTVRYVKGKCWWGRAPAPTGF